MRAARHISPLARIAVFDAKFYCPSLINVPIWRSQHTSTSTEANEEGNIITADKIQLEKPSFTKWKRPPFIKNLFIGKFDTHVLAFPEVLNKELVKKMEDCVESVRDLYRNKVNSSQIDKDRKIPEDVLQHLKDMGFFGRMVPKEYGGLGLTRTEYTRLNEIVSLDWSIGAMLCAHECLGIEALMLFGNEEQKAKYLPDLASGKKIAAVCGYEALSGSDDLSMQTVVTYLPDKECYEISGMKSWVTNAEYADLFIVIAKNMGNEDHDQNYGTAFLVEKGADGLEITKRDDVVGLKGSGAGCVHFKEVFVPKEDMLGAPGTGVSILMKLREASRFAQGSLSFSTLKCLFNSITDYIVNAERGGRTLSYYQLIRTRLSKVLRMIYAMESVAYFTAAIYDTTDNPDLVLEDTILKVFNSEGTLFCVRELMEAVGSVSLSEQQDIQRLHRDAQALSYFDVSNDLCRLLIGLMACQYAGNNHADRVLKSRNPMVFPMDVLKKFVANRRISLERFNYDQDLAGHLHPSLVLHGNQLEECVQRLSMAVDSVLITHGRDVMETQFSPTRLADLTINIYVRAAVLSRFSRSYCIGLRNTHEELYLASLICSDANESFIKIFRDIVEKKAYQDEIHLTVGEYIVNKKGYFPEHPLKHNL